MERFAEEHNGDGPLHPPISPDGTALIEAIDWNEPEQAANIEAQQMQTAPVQETALPKPNRQVREIEATPQEVSVGGLQHLLNESSKYPLLTPGQEINLSKRIERGDLEAKELLINSNLRLVVFIAKRSQNQGLPMLDLVQEGMLGLMRAAEKFDWRKRFRFSTYATLWIRQSIARGLDDTSRTIRLPANKAQRARTIKRAENELTQKLLREPSPEELSALTGYPSEEIIEIQELQRKSQPVSLNKPVTEDQDTELGDLIPTTADMDAAESNLRQEEARGIIERAFDDAELTDLERKVLGHLFGLETGEPKNYTQTANIVGIKTIAGVKGAEERALKKLRKLDSSPLHSLKESA